MRPLLFAAVLGAAAAAALPSARAATNACDRACLEGFVDQYLAAQVARDPFSLPLAHDLKFVENDKVLEMGDGSWNVVTAVGPYKVYVADPQSGQVGFFGTVHENGTPVALALRLKIVAGRIAEIEALLNRDAGVGAAFEALGKPDPMYAQPLTRRMSRAAMIAAGDAYWDGIEQSRGAKVPFADDCDRLQNAVRTTNNAELKQPDRGWSPVALPCKAQFDTGYYKFIPVIYPRRNPIVDEERGIVLSFVSMQAPGNILSVDVPGHGTVPVPTPYFAPNFVNAVEAFKLRDGKIARIFNVQLRVPFGLVSPFHEGDWRRSPAPAFAASRDDAAARACDRACLQGFADRYLQAMVAHDPAKVPLAREVISTENDIVLRPGEGLWRTASAVGGYRNYFVDTHAGQVGYFGTIRENGRGAAITLRLRVRGGQITEAEQVVIRNESTFNNMEKQGTPDPVMLQVPAGAARLPRAELVRITNTYFEAIEQGNGGVGEFHPECNRFENGIMTSGTTGCAAQLDTKIFDYISSIYPRRYLVVDEERQNVFGFFMFNHHGDITWVNSPGQGRRDMIAAAKRPFSVDVGEAFSIRDGKLRKVEALMTSLPYGTRSPWVPKSP